MRKIIMAFAALALALSFTPGSADPLPSSYSFCLPDLDGHCRFCELRLKPSPNIRCTSH